MHVKTGSERLTRRMLELKYNGKRYQVRSKKRWEEAKWLRNSLSESSFVIFLLAVKKEELALAALNQWETIPLLGCKLVPEHVETRVLYHPNLTGETQGMLQLWVDIFDSTQDIPPEINIVPRHPEPYELRVTVWDTHDMALHDYSIISGSYSSDIYVLGIIVMLTKMYSRWLCKEKTTQKTDIHYRSLTGEGNFNYRLIFNFDYWSAEGKISLPKKSTTAQPQKPRIKFPCILVMEAWDNNHIFRDDKLGILKLNLLRVPQGARSSRLCTLETLGLKTLTTDLFVQKRTRGWWPFQVESEDGPKLTFHFALDKSLTVLEEDSHMPTEYALATRSDITDTSVQLVLFTFHSKGRLSHRAYHPRSRSSTLCQGRAPPVQGDEAHRVSGILHQHKMLADDSSRQLEGRSLSPPSPLAVTDQQSSRI
ncbi:hypothetical protein PR048_008168 [Dryococelus australis]|uniref:Uncharacterized protein n=1 Tax=Dryococelus australis TaxID=614101 RepID=A0ABQ9HWC0_9NEOP|nr:hypothetical protein PR048_008168 [Dryococelus australis]